MTQKLLYQVYQKFSYRFYINTINLLLSTVLVYCLVATFYTVLSAHIRPPVTMHSQVKTAKAENRPAVFGPPQPRSHYDTIVKRNLFQIQTRETVPAERFSLENIDHTDLALRLWGTVLGKRTRSYAVIEDTGARKRRNRQDLYHAGDRIQGATIKKILDEKVILEHNGRNEVLEMEKLRRRRGAAGRPSLFRSRKPIVQGLLIRKSQIDRAMQNLPKLMRQIRVSPHRDGIRLTRVRPRSIFRRMGLRNGDVVTAVDGQPIQSMNDAMGLYEKLENSSRVKLELKRRGRERIINYTIR